VLAVILLAIPAWRGLFKELELERKLRQPSANAQSLFLQESEELTRSPQEAPRISIGGETGWVLLHCSIIDRSRETPRYRAEIVDHGGTAIWRSEAALSAGNDGVLSIICRRSFFRLGQYRLKVYELSAALQPTGEVFEFPFRVSFVKKSFHLRSFLIPPHFFRPPSFRGVLYSLTPPINFFYNSGKDCHAVTVFET